MNIDQIALDTAQAIIGLPSSHEYRDGETQKVAQLQCIIAGTIKEAVQAAERDRGIMEKRALAYKAGAEKIQAERDALAAQAELLRSELQEYADKGSGHVVVCQGSVDSAHRVLREAPSTSLDRLKAQWQAEGGEHVANVIGGAHDRKLALMRVAELRRQAEELKS